MDKKRREDGKELISEQCTNDEEACTARGCSYTLAIIIALTTYVSLHSAAYSAAEAIEFCDILF